MMMQKMLGALVVSLLLSYSVSNGAVVKTNPSQCGSLWSQGSTWSTGTVPKEKDFVQIDAGCTVVYDLATSPNLAEVNIDGALVFALNKSTELKVSLLIVEPTGRLEIGTALQPLPAQHTAVIKLVDMPEQSHTHMHGQALIAPALHTHGGQLLLHGAVRERTWTTLVATAQVGSTVLMLKESVNSWKVGDSLVLSGTQTISEVSQTEELTVMSVSDKTVTVKEPLKFVHKGVFPSQAAVGLLSHNIKIVSATPEGRRGHVMVAHGFVVADNQPLPAITSPVKADIRYVEFKQLGRPEAGIYPVHFHRLSSDGRNSKLLGSSIHKSSNLCVRVHTTNFLNVEGNVCYDAIGHGFATEDGTEVYNSFTKNLAVKTKKAVIKTNPNDLSDVNEGSGFWVNNPRNRLIENYAGDVEGWGFQVDPITTGGNPARGKTVETVDSEGKVAAPVDVTTIAILEMRGNVVQSGKLGGGEIVNIDSTEWSVVEGFHARDVGFGMAAFAVLARFESVNTVGGVNFYSPGNFTGIPLSKARQQHFKNSTFDTQLTGYQFAGTVLFENTTMRELWKTGSGIPTLYVMIGEQRAKGLILDIQAFAPDTTIQQEVYMFHQDGLNKHLKLIPGIAKAADGLVYGPSRFRACTADDPSKRRCYQEAKFESEGLVGPLLRMPVRIKAGSIATHGHIPGVPADLIDSQGKRWMSDQVYLKGPDGVTVYRYGSRNMSRGPGDNDIQSLHRTIGVANGVSTALSYWPMQYLMDIPAARYHVDIYMMEPGETVVGKRVFSIKAEGVTVVSNLDIVKETGGSLREIVRSFDVDVNDGQLVLEWTERGVVSAIEVCLVSQVVAGKCAA